MIESGDPYERLLRAARPAPRPEFARELEEVLLRRVAPAEAARTRVPTVFAALAFTAALAAVVFALAVTGLLPAGLGRDDPVSAEQRQRSDACRTVATAPQLVGRETGRCQVSSRRADGR